MDSGDLQRFVKETGIRAEVVYLPEETPTVEAAAAVAGCLPEQIGKSILFLVEEAPYLVVANGLNRIGYKALADYLGTSRRRLRLAKPGAVLDITGYPVGTVPPFGHKEKLPTIVEARVMEQDEIFAGGGAINALMRLSPEELVRVSGAEVVSLPHPADVNQNRTGT